MQAGHCFLWILNCIVLSWKLPVGGYHQSRLGWPFSFVFVEPVMAQYYSHWIFTLRSYQGVSSFVWIWASLFWLRCARQPFGIKTLSQAYALVRINPHDFGWLLSFFQFLGEEIYVVSLETLFCGLQYSAWLLELFHGLVVSFGNTVWVVFLDKYPLRTQVALNPEVELLRCMCKGCSYIKA